MELNPPTGQVVQARGACNRPASGDEEAMIRYWVQAVVQPRLRSPATR